MSATLEHQRLSSFFGGAPVVEVQGRCYQITERSPGKSLEHDVALDIKAGKDVLIFQPGKREIDACITVLRSLGAKANFYPLHADLLPADQDRCLEPSDLPKCIVATNVAEASLTLPGVQVVRDSGLERRIEIRDAVEGLYLGPIALSSRDQRRGRTGRTGPGEYCDYCPIPQARRADYPTPEIQRVFLDQLVLRLAQQGLDAEKLSFLHQPDQARLRQAKHSLRFLGLLQGDLAVTPLGDEVAALPISARTGKMLLEAHKRGVSDSVLTAASILEVGAIHQRDFPACLAAANPDSDSDILTQASLFQLGCKVAAESSSSPVECQQRLSALGLVPRLFFKVLETRHHLADVFRKRVGEPLQTGSRRQILDSLILGQLDLLFRADRSGRVFYRVSGDNTPRWLASGSLIQFEAPPYLVVGQPFNLGSSKNSASSGRALIEMATRVDLSQLISLAPDLVRITSAQVGGRKHHRNSGQHKYFFRGSFIHAEGDSGCEPRPRWKRFPNKRR